MDSSDDLMLPNDHAEQVNAQNMYYQAYNETYFCELFEYDQRLDASKEYANAYLEIYLREAEAPSVIERGRKRKRLSKEERHEAERQRKAICKPVCGDKCQIKCRECQEYFVHKDALNECSSSCEKCKSYTLHKERAKNARTAYRSDAALPNSDSDIIVSADLQKVIMLPRINMFKIVLFTRRLCLFNETFATVGPKRNDKKKVNTAYLWHEGIAGRKDEDIASTFWKFINDNRDATSITFWLDNCAGQNKNWSIFTMFSTAVNAENMHVNTITLKYFERGHTFMSADSTHAEIEEQLRKMDKVCDFQDFVKCVESTSCRAQEMEPKAFKKWVSGTSQHKLRKTPDRPMLADISIAEFRRGNLEFFYKTEHTTDEFKSCSYLLDDFVLSEKRSQNGARGISDDKKKDILKKLVPLMSESRRQFWREFAVSDAPDLIDNE